MLLEPVVWGGRWPLRHVDVQALVSFDGLEDGDERANSGEGKTAR